MGNLAQREAFGKALAEYGQKNERIIVLDADTSSSTMSNHFAKRYPGRFINVGIAEPCLVDVGVGLALGGFIPFLNAFAALISLRAVEQIRTCVAYAHTNVKIAASYAGLSDYKDGPTHHSIMDIAIMRMMPGMTVIVPSDEIEIKKWVPIIAEYEGPVYFRLSRAETGLVHNGDLKLEIGKGITLQQGKDVTIIAIGSMVSRSLQAAEELKDEGISTRVVAMPTIKPIDRDLIIKSASETGAIVTVEEHSILGGLGGAVSEVISEEVPTPIVRVGIRDTFTRTALDVESLLDEYGMSVNDIVSAVNNVLIKK